MTIGERIKQRRKELGLSVDELADKLGKNRATIYRYESNEIEKLPTTVLEPLADVLGVSPGFLMGWEDEPSEPSNIELLPKNEVRMIPVFETVSAGFGAYASNEIIGYMPLYIESNYEAEETLCIKVKGDSMYPKIENGDIVQVHKQDSVDNGQIAVVLVDGDEGLVKKVFVYKDYIELISVNPEYPPKRFEKEEMNRVEIVGLVRKIIKEC
jgi:repressor LexA